MQRSGFVLAGGASTRMGRDKALLPYLGIPLVQHLAQSVQAAAGSVALVGDPERYASLGYPVYPDRLRGCGPMGGIYTALIISKADWNLIVACDMPGVAPGVLRLLLQMAGEFSGNCVVATGPTGEAEPLCAVYHRNCLPALARAMERKRFKMKELVAELDSRSLAVQASALANVNTPAEWADFKTNPSPESTQ